MQELGAVGRVQFHRVQLGYRSLGVDDGLSGPGEGPGPERNHAYVEIDLVGADRQPVAKRLLFLGSVKWLENSAFDSHDLAALHKHRAAVTDDPMPLIAVSRSGVNCAGLQATYGPQDLLTAWRRN